MSRTWTKIFLIVFFFLSVLPMHISADAEETADNLLFNGDFELLDDEGLLQLIGELRELYKSFPER